MVLLPGADAAAAARLAEGVRAAIEALHLEHAANPPAGVVTASVGVATMSPAHANTAGRPDDLVAAADAALYAAKHAGRNRIVCAVKLPAGASAPVLPAAPGLPPAPELPAAPGLPPSAAAPRARPAPRASAARLTLPACTPRGTPAVIKTSSFCNLMAIDTP